MPFISSNPSNMEYTFWMCAVGGTLFFLLRVMVAVVGGFGHDDFDTDGHGDVHAHDVDGHDAHDGHGHESDVAFKLLSLNSVSAFIMMFGWAGLTAYSEYQLGNFLSFLIALVVGFITMMLTSYLFVLAHKLTSEGANFKIEQTVGQTAKVYQRIPANGRGKIHITVNGMLRELDALSEGDEEIESFNPVTITEVVAPSLVRVKKT